MTLKRPTNLLLGGKDSARVFKGMAKLTLGGGLAKLIGIASIPLITRIYSPEDLGLVAVFVAPMVMISPLLTLRYSLAVPLPRYSTVALNLMALCIILTLTIGGFITISLALFKLHILALFSATALLEWWWLLAIGLIGASTYELFSLWATRKKDYGSIAHTSVTQSVGGAVAKVGLGLLGAGTVGLLVGQILATSGGVLHFAKKFAGDFKDAGAKITKKRIFKVAIHYRGFPIYRAPSQFLLIFSQQAPLLFASILFGSKTTGQLSLALTIIALPLGLLGGALGKVLYGEAAGIGMRDRSRLYKLAKSVQIRLAVLAAPPAAILYLSAPKLFTTVFGEPWAEAGHFASLLAVYLVFQFTSAPLMQLLNLLRSQHTFLLINIFRAILILTLFQIAKIAKMSPESFVLFYSLTMSALYMFMTLLIMQRIKTAANDM